MVDSKEVHATIVPKLTPRIVIVPDPVDKPKEPIAKLPMAGPAQRLLHEHKHDESRRPSLFSLKSFNHESELGEMKPSESSKSFLKHQDSCRSEDGRKTSDMKHEKREGAKNFDSQPHRRPSAFDSVLQALRRPSAATLEVFNNLRRNSGIGSRSGSHATIDSR